MNARRDYHQVLGVPRDADAKALKKAFRQLARRYHPDTSTAPAGGLCCVLPRRRDPDPVKGWFAHPPVRTAATRILASSMTCCRACGMSWPTGRAAARPGRWSPSSRRLRPAGRTRWTGGADPTRQPG